MKTVIVGGASISWIPIFTQDFCKCEEMRGATLVLHDINVPQMEFLKVFIEKVMEEKQHYFTVEIEPELDRALEGADCALPGFVDSKNEEKTERNAGYLVVSHSGGGMLRQGTRKGIRRTPANRGMRAHWVVKGLDISEDVCHGMCP